MPTSADTPASPRARFTHVLLLGALGAALCGLALTGGAPTVTVASSTAMAPEVLHGAPLPTAAPAATVARTKAAVVRRTAPLRATRTRVASGRWALPVAAGVVSSYGMRWGRMHQGLDFGAHYGAPIRAVGDGVVIGAGYLASEGGYGKIVLIRHRSGAVTAYAHLSRALVHSGERVHAGDLIGRVGSTGHVTGPHLHFEVRVGGAQVNPRTWLRRHGVYC